MNIAPLTDWRGRVTHFVAIERDVSELKQTEQQLRDDAWHDPLTRVYNRRGFQVRCEMLERRIQSEPHSNIALITLDIDHFKQINDRWGHDAGDQVLVAVAQTMTRMMRANDLVCRIGGEEFVIVLAAADLSKAAAVAERVRQEVMKLSVKTHDGDSISVTASLGVATFSLADTSVPGVLRRADEALYRAKAAGRNCVVTAAQ
jgi:diguanylate cyclase (GGDEF)-like protein